MLFINSLIFEINRKDWNCDGKEDPGSGMKLRDDVCASAEEKGTTADEMARWHH